VKHQGGKKTGDECFQVVHVGLSVILLSRHFFV
jgi:hypothetical protein